MRLLGALLVFTIAAQAAPPIPETPVGRILTDWLEAFNSGDKQRLAAHYGKHREGESAERAAGLRAMSGGFELIEILESEPHRLAFRLKERKEKGGDVIAAMTLDDDNPVHVERFMIRLIPPNGGEPDFKIDAKARELVIETAIEKLREHYVFPETAERLAEDLRARQGRGEYASIRSGDSFAALLTEQLRESSKDKHLGVIFSPVPTPPRPRNQQPDPKRQEQQRKMLERQNCGFQKVELLTGNVGYVKFNAFARARLCGETVAAAMSFVAHADALIFDLRQNGGGDPEMVQLISSYLFSKPTHLNDLWTRKGDETKQFWTLSTLPGKRLPDDRPVYVLTSKRTFSAAEEFSYNLQQLERATIVGETTGGGAHPVRGERIDGRFMVMVPFARAINPVSNENWEGVGVKPDVEVAADEALEKAERLARERPRE